ncbi:MAG: DUF4292 domain-containing protein [Saprospiraceae bacterium]|nr:DUF4292 domain-containing protein [Saprospiraceae bacterium]
MKKKYFAPAFVLLAGLFFLLSAKESGCRKKTTLRAPLPATELRKPDFLLKKLRAQQHPDLYALTAQAKVFIEGDGQSVSATANIIWLRDSVLWVNIKKFGFEAARALITKDSVFVLNRLDKTYTAGGLESLQRQYSLPAGFELLQSVVLAEAWFFPELSLNADIKDGLHRLSGSNGRYTADYRMPEATFWLQQVFFYEQREARSVSILFEKYKNEAVAGWFPYLRTVEAFSEESGSLRLSIEFNDVSFNQPKSYRFEIPGHYERMQ